MTDLRLQAVTGPSASTSLDQLPSSSYRTGADLAIAGKWERGLRQVAWLPDRY